MYCIWVFVARTHVRAGPAWSPFYIILWLILIPLCIVGCVLLLALMCCCNSSSVQLNDDQNARYDVTVAEVGENKNRDDDDQNARCDVTVVEVDENSA